MNRNKAPGIDRIQLKHLQDSAQNTSIVIAKIINKTIDEEIWPTKLKIQILRPIYKGGKAKELTNYRPISLLPILDKILEK